MVNQSALLSLEDEPFCPKLGLIQLVIHSSLPHLDLQPKIRQYLMYKFGFVVNPSKPSILSSGIRLYLVDEASDGLGF